jgi:hypothetical protein
MPVKYPGLNQQLRASRETISSDENNRYCRQLSIEMPQMNKPAVMRLAQEYDAHPTTAHLAIVYNNQR